MNPYLFRIDCDEPADLEPVDLTPAPALVFAGVAFDSAAAARAWVAALDSVQLVREAHLLGLDRFGLKGEAIRTELAGLVEDAIADANLA